MRIASASAAREMDSLAERSWGLNAFALVEAAGRSCADALVKFLGDRYRPQESRLIVFAGSGNNGADALVLLRTLIVKYALPASHGRVIVHRPNDGGPSVRNQALLSVSQLDVPVIPWEEEALETGELRSSDILIDGIVGTGIRGPLSGVAERMAGTLNRLRYEGDGEPPTLVSIDVPSGLFDLWVPPMPMVQPDLVLAVEPVKELLYRPAIRPLIGTPLAVEGIFPQKLLATLPPWELVNFKDLVSRIPQVSPRAYKHQRGVVEIWAGSPGASGAARIAARGAQAAGAGLVRLRVDREIQDVLTANAGGVMVSRGQGEGGAAESDRFSPQGVLLGPGWSWSDERARILRTMWEREQGGLALVLDADAIAPAKEYRFSGRTIFTPHPGEFLRLLEPGSVTRETLAADPIPLLQRVAQERNATILLKGHVLHIASPDGRVSVVDGMVGALAAGGSGDLLAGFTVALAARMARLSESWDPHTCALAAAALLIEAGREAAAEMGFMDPLEIAPVAARLAGNAWL